MINDALSKAEVAIRAQLCLSGGELFDIAVNKLGLDPDFLCILTLRISYFVSPFGLHSETSAHTLS